MQFSQCFAMPDKATTTIAPIRSFAESYISQVKKSAGSQVEIVDPFARNCELGTITNDLDTDTLAQYHLKADEFLDMLLDKGVKAGLVIYDPPYSVRQIAECYKSVGLDVTQTDTQCSFYTRVKARIKELVFPGGYVLSFGWNSMGVGKVGFETKEIMLVTHGGCHNDTLCVAQQKTQMELF